jgi:hypothetical protein
MYLTHPLSYTHTHVHAQFVSTAAQTDMGDGGETAGPHLKGFTQAVQLAHERLGQVGPVQMAHTDSLQLSEAGEKRDVAGSDRVIPKVELLTFGEGILQQIAPLSTMALSNSHY